MDVAAAPGGRARAAARERTETVMQRAGETAGMRVVFWIWAGILVVGLAVMIAIPLTGR
jgi:hypothetical protein